MTTVLESPAISPSMTLHAQTCVPDTDADEVVIAWYHHTIPLYVEEELQRLYRHVFSSLLKMRVYGCTENASTYVVRRRGEIIALFLFRIEGAAIQVLNEFITIDAAEMNRFARYLFDSFRSVHIIRFGSVDCGTGQPAFPFHRVNRAEDIVAVLPKTMQEYTNRLGRSTRQNINYYRNKLKRHAQSFSFDVFDANAIDERHFHAIIGLNRMRMAGKAKTQGFDDAESRRLLAMVKATGMMCVVTIDGKVRAGTLCYRIGSHFFVDVIAHDPAYNEYGLGTLACYLTIGECIARGATHFHFLWGREEYKYRLLGEQRDFDCISLYRSRLHAIIDGRNLMNTARKGWERQLKLWLLDPARRNHPLLKTAVKWVRAVKRMRQEGVRSIGRFRTTGTTPQG